MSEYYTSEDFTNGTYLQLPKALIYDDEYRDLSADEVILYAVLRDRINLSKEHNKSFEDETGLFILYSQSALAVVMGKSERTIRRSIKALKEHKLILIVQDEKGKPGRIYIKNIVGQKCPRRTEMSYERRSKMSYGVGQKCPTNNTDNSKTDNYIYKGRAKFVKPTLEEVQDYCQQKGYSFDPVKFFSHYESNGWMIGKSHMKSWKAACVTWQRNVVNFKNSKPKDDGTHTNWADEAERGWGD